MDFDLAAFWRAASYVLAVVLGVLIKQWLELKPKLYYWLSSASGIQIQDPNTGNYIHPNTHTVVIQNAGRKSATNVRLGHNNIQNLYYQVYPNIQHQKVALPGGGFDIVFPTVTPKRIINITYFYFAPITFDQINTHFESDEGQAQHLPMTTQRVFPQWFNVTASLLMLLGLITLVYLLWEFIPWLWGLWESVQKMGKAV